MTSINNGGIIPRLNLDMPEQETTINELMGFLQNSQNKNETTFAEHANRIDELVEFLQENMMTKNDAKNFATKQDLADLGQRLDQKIDYVYSSLSSQINSIESELKDIKQQLEKLEKRTLEDADAAAEDILALQRRVEILERQVKNLQPA